MVASFLHLHLDALTLEPFEHPLILLRRREPGPYRLPWPARPDAAVLCLLYPDQRGLRRRIDRMVVHLEPELQGKDVLLLARQRVQLVHWHQPRPRHRLLRPIPEIALIAR